MLMPPACGTAAPLPPDTWMCHCLAQPRQASSYPTKCTLMASMQSAGHRPCFPNATSCKGVDFGTCLRSTRGVGECLSGTLFLSDCVNISTWLAQSRAYAACLSVCMCSHNKANTASMCKSSTPRQLYVVNQQGLHYLVQTRWAVPAVTAQPQRPHV